ncbi:arylesterase [Leeuwenhoekiella aequorea]|uniref:Acyl-CoA thioesterase-1 n=1 Tax=Leeuwenhoekiella aequorea TaxID=283736 RepID=A0A4Q0P9H5_9FLAO|nr:arylesterase [Leeuwenhoekiella aequorea]RXG23373.1 acyl-CoA thioesterase-1 [Leeuwenhoekiella aequorea]
MRTFLLVCCFLISISLGSCNNKTSKTKTTSTQVDSETSEITETSDTINKTILFFGDSLTAGYGLDNPENAFPGLIQKMIDSLQLNYTVVNAGISGETTSGGKNRLDWILETDIDIFVLELGANDGLRGLPVSETKNNLQDIINRVQSKIPDVQIVLAGMQLPPNLGTQYTQDFKQTFYDLAKKNDLTLIPFLLEDVGGIAKLNQSDGIHPTADGHKIIAKNIFPILKPLMNLND